MRRAVRSWLRAGSTQATARASQSSFYSPTPRGWTWHGDLALLHPQFLHLLGSSSHGFGVGRNAATQFKALYSPQEPVLMKELGYTPCNGD